MPANSSVQGGSVDAFFFQQRRPLASPEKTSLSCISQSTAHGLPHALSKLYFYLFMKATLPLPPINLRKPEPAIRPLSHTLALVNRPITLLCETNSAPLKTPSATPQPQANRNQQRNTRVKNTRTLQQLVTGILAACFIATSSQAGLIFTIDTFTPNELTISIPSGPALAGTAVSRDFF